MIKDNIFNCQHCNKKFHSTKAGYISRYNILDKKVCSNCYQCYRKHNTFERKIQPRGTDYCKFCKCRLHQDLKGKFTYYRIIGKVACGGCYEKLRNILRGERSRYLKSLSPERLLMEVGYYEEK